MEEIQQALLTALTLVATTAVGVGAKYLCSLLKRLGDKAEVQTSKIEDEKAEILLKNILDNLFLYIFHRSYFLYIFLLQLYQLL